MTRQRTYCVFCAVAFGRGRFGVNAEQREPNHQLGFEHILPSLIFGFGAIIQSVLDIPGTLDCDIILNNNTVHMPAGYDKLNDAWTEVNLLYKQIIPYSFIKATFIGLQVKRAICYSLLLDCFSRQGIHSLRQVKWTVSSLKGNSTCSVSPIVEL